MLNTYNQWTFENKSEDIFSAFNTKKHQTKFCTNTPLYELCSNLICVINLLSILIHDEIVDHQKKHFHYFWINLQIFFNFLFLIEYTTDLYFDGFIKAYKNKFRIWIESIAQIIFIYGIITWYRYSVKYENLITIF